jgi:hypothetical protein
MGLRHCSAKSRFGFLASAAPAVSSDSPERAAAKRVIVEAVELLRWRLWDSKSQDAQISLDQIRAQPPHPNQRSSTS